MDWRRSSSMTTEWAPLAVSPEDLALMESTEDPDELRAIVERIILADRATKEEVAS